MNYTNYLKKDVYVTWNYLDAFTQGKFINFGASYYSYCILHSLYPKLNKLSYKAVFVRLRGLGMLSCRSPPFLFSNKFFEMKRRTTKWIKSITCL